MSDQEKDSSSDTKDSKPLTRAHLPELVQAVVEALGPLKRKRGQEDPGEKAGPSTKKISESTLIK